MALDSQYITIPFTKGYETKINPALVDKGKLLALQNYTFAKDGTLSKRDGWQLLSGTTLSNGVSNQAEIFSCSSNRELCVIDNTNNISSYTPTGASVLTTVNGVAPFLQVRKDPIISNVSGIAAMDSATYGNLTGYLYNQVSQGNTRLAFTVIDEVTGSVVTSQVFGNASATCPRIIDINTTGFVLAFNNAGALTALVYTASTNSLSGTTILASDIAASALFELVKFGTEFVAVWNTNEGSNTDSIRAQLFNSSLASVSGPIQVIPVTSIAQNAITALTASSFGDSSPTHVGVIVGKSGASQIFTAVLQISSNVLTRSAGPSGGIAVSAQVAILGSCQTIIGTIQFVISPSLIAGPPIAIQVGTLLTNNGSGGINTVVTNAVPITSSHIDLVAQPFYSATYSTVIIPLFSNLQGTIHFLDSSGNYIGEALYGLTNELGITSALVPHVAILSNTATSFTMPVLEQDTTAGPETLSRVAITTGRNTQYATTNSGDKSIGPLWHTDNQDGTFLSGAFVSIFDTKQNFEAGFAYTPNNVAITDSGGGTNTSSGQYLAIAVYEWYDGLGNRHQSAASNVAKITLSNTHSPTMTCPSLQIGQRKATTYIVFYRSTANGTTLFRDSTQLTNNLSSTSITFTSTATDTALAANESLYTTGGTLPNNTPEACRVIATHQNRVFIAGLENPQEIRYSQQAISRIGLQWNQALSILVPAQYGEVTGLISLDDKLIVFTPTRTLVLLGNGPDSTGVNSTYNLQTLPSDVGCIDQRSIVVIPDINSPDSGVQKAGGVGFQSQHGYYLLTRSLVPEYIGMEVENDIVISGVNKSIISAVVLDNKSQLRLLISGQSYVLVYDYLWGQWSKHSGTSVTPIAACINYASQYTFIDSTTPIIYNEISSATSDSNGVIIGTIQTSWLKLANLQGFERVRRLVILGSLVSGNSNLQINVDYNYVANQHGAGAYNFTITGTSTITPANRPFEFRHHLQQQTCEAISFTFVDTPTIFRGVNFTGIMLELAMKKGTGKTFQPSQQG